MNAIVVDDERIAREGLCEQLHQIELIGEVHEFCDADSTLDYLVKNTADVAFLDINMRKMHGIVLASEIRKRCPTCAILFVTGYSEYAVEAFRIHAEGYLLKPVKRIDIERELKHLTQTVKKKTEHRVRMQCFGNFEVFCDNMPVRFARTQTKELLALLVDRKGAAMNTEQICAMLWEDSRDISFQKNKLRHLVSDLVNTLKQEGVDDIFLKKRNSFAIKREQLDCDYYSYLQGHIDGENAFMGEYLSQYSWAEVTLGALKQSSI